MKGSTRKYVDRKCLLCSTKFVLMKKCCQYIYIYDHSQTVSLYHCSSVWLNMRDVSSCNQNSANLTSVGYLTPKQYPYQRKRCYFLSEYLFTHTLIGYQGALFMTWAFRTNCCTVFVDLLVNTYMLRPEHWVMTRPLSWSKRVQIQSC